MTVKDIEKWIFESEDRLKAFGDGISEEHRDVLYQLLNIMGSTLNGKARDGLRTFRRSLRKDAS